MPASSGTPTWYWVLAFLVSLYHAYRGYRVQWVFAQQQNQGFKKAELCEFTTVDIVVVRCLEDAFFHFVCSAAGFLALLVASALWGTFGHREAIDAGASVLIVFTFLLGLIGVCGQLPPLIQLGKIPLGR